MSSIRINTPRNIQDAFILENEPLSLRDVRGKTHESPRTLSGVFQDLDSDNGSKDVTSFYPAFGHNWNASLQSQNGPTKYSLLDRDPFMDPPATPRLEFAVLAWKPVSKNSVRRPLRDVSNGYCSLSLSGRFAQDFGFDSLLPSLDGPVEDDPEQSSKLRTSLLDESIDE